MGRDFFQNMNEWGIFSTLKAGLMDSVNPGGLTVLVVFAVLLFSLARQRRSVWGTGALFILGNCLLTGMLSLGAFDHIILTQVFERIWDTAYFLIPAGMVLLGGMILRDWHGFKKGNSRDKLFIKFCFREKADHVREHKGKILLRGLGVFLLGIFLAFIEAAWAPDPYISILLYRMVYEPGVGPRLLLGLYVITFVFPLIAAVILIQRMALSETFQKRMQIYFSRYQLGFSAVLLAYGLTFLYSYFLQPVTIPA